MDDVVRNALVAVAEAETALANAEAQLRAAWAERINALQASSLVVAFVHDSYPAPLTQRIVVTDSAGGRTIDIAQLTAEAVA